MYIGNRRVIVAGLSRSRVLKYTLARRRTWFCRLMGFLGASGILARLILFCKVITAHRRVMHWKHLEDTDQQSSASLRHYIAGN